MLPSTNREDVLDASECLAVIDEVLSVIGGKWSVLVMTNLKAGPLRFNVLKRKIVGISTQSLTAFLRQLEQAGIVNRKVYPTLPVSVEYSLTDKGLDYTRLIEEIRKCGLAWRTPANRSGAEE